MTRIGLIGVAVLAGLAAVVLGLWGTSWTVSRASAAGAGYMLLAIWDGAGSPGGALERPIGIDVSPMGHVYVTDALQRVVRFSPGGEVLGQWGGEGNEPGEFSNAVGVAVGRDGAVYVSDYDHDRVQKFTAEGEFLLDFGRSGAGPAEFNAPAGLVVDGDGFVYVADFYNHRVQSFREDGSFEQVIGHSGRLGLGALHYPTGVAITGQHELLVADAYNYQLQWFDLYAHRQPMRRVGYHLFWLWPRPVSSNSGFFVPTDAAVGPDGAIHVADSGNHRVVMLSANGEYLAEWGIPDADPNIFSPEHIAASPDGLTVYATDLAGSRVLVLSVKTPEP